MSPSISGNLKQRKKIKEEQRLQEFFSLRRMEEKDLSNVLAIEHLSFPNPWNESTFRGEIHNRPFSFPFVIVHKFQDRVIGYLLYWVIREEVHLNNIAVHPDFRRQGVADAVLRKLLAQVKSEGAEFMTLEVRPSNAAALGLYKKFGFKVIAIRKNYYFNPKEDAIILGRPF